MPLLRSVMANTRRLLLPVLAGFGGRLGLGGGVKLHLAPRSARSSRRRGWLGLPFWLRRWGPYRRKAAPWLFPVVLLFRRQSLPSLLCRWHLSPLPGSCLWNGSTAASCQGKDGRRLGRLGLARLCVWVRILPAVFPGTPLLRLHLLPPFLVVALAGSFKMLATSDEAGAAIIALDGDFPYCCWWSAILLGSWDPRP